MGRKGLEVELHLECGDRGISWMFEGLKSVVIVAEDGESLRFRFAVSGRTVTAEAHNRWNRDYRFSRSLMDDDGDPVLVLDLDLAGGVCEGRIVDIFGSCLFAVVRWIKEILVASDGGRAAGVIPFRPRE
jgi:hypothetical protein